MSSLAFSEIGGSKGPADSHTSPSAAQKGGRRRRRTAKRSSKKWFVWKGGHALDGDPIPGEKGGCSGGKRRRKSRKHRKSKKFFGLFN
jgi:hypothetical protein